MRFQLLSIFFFLTTVLQAQIHHQLDVTINPELSTIQVRDEITLPEGKETSFFLNEDLLPKPITKGLSINKIAANQKAKDIGMDHDQGTSSLRLTEWHVAWQDRYPAAKTFVIEYSGKINAPMEQSENNYQRGFSESPGIISQKGIYLAGSTYWVPIFGDAMMTFVMDVHLPKGWKSVSQGVRTKEENQGAMQLEQWSCDKLQEEAFLIGAQFSEYSFDAGNVKAMAFLRTPDEGLANKYLETTAQYLEMYRQILGLYPYSKFALVENFWETGYGMPSFTLLGEKIIRFPFIMHSSYPHELLHNWWGNSVYVDFEKGNWCEGLTAYMADHLIKEQRGKGEDYRRSTLQKFSDLVNTRNDFPLTDFRSRYDGPSEAIGYGKSLMMWHMLRRKFGDETFLRAMQKFYRSNKFKRASFDDIRLAFEAVTEQDLKPFFEQWVTRKGAPELVLEDTQVQKLLDGTYQVAISLRQKQEEPAFVLDVPLAIVTQNGTLEFVREMKTKSQKFVFSTESEPMKVLVDPKFDLFRILDSKEVAPALTKAYGSPKTLILLPKGTPKGSAYDVFARSWVKEEP
ncbi:MAG TPA: peptidase M28, partial [Saprospiraceae bacterium]|nr:peptidase M28 [Saprospiraceae bacterium]